MPSEAHENNSAANRNINATALWIIIDSPLYIGPLKEERWGVRTNRIKDMLEGEDTVKFIRSLQI